MKTAYYKRCILEFIGTFFLVFAGCGAMLVNDLYGGVLGHLGVSLVFGLVVMAVIYAIGEISGAHINPAVTIAFAFAKRFPLKDTPFYIAFQILGAIAASYLLRFLFPGLDNYGMTTTTLITFKAILFEVIISFFLMFVIIHVSEGSKEQGLMAGVAVGFTVLLSSLYAGPVTGASMNPARSIGPAIASGHIQGQWIYLIAPVLGTTLAVLVWRFLFDKER